MNNVCIHNFEAKENVVAHKVNTEELMKYILNFT